jgi:hypothetical protein
MATIDSELKNQYKSKKLIKHKMNDEIKPIMNDTQQNKYKNIKKNNLEQEEDPKVEIRKDVDMEDPKVEISKDVDMEDPKVEISKDVDKEDPKVEISKYNDNRTKIDLDNKKFMSKINQVDKYTPDVLRRRYNRFKSDYIDLSDLINLYGLPIRHQNPPEDITENIVKFIIINYENDLSCKWAKGIGLTGDLFSKNYSINYPPEVKALTSDGPSSFGPKKKFGVIYFLDMRKWLNDLFILWKVNVSNESAEWKKIKMNKHQTNENQCDEGRRPHISWNNIYSQISEKCEKIYEGTFENIFINKAKE